MKTHPLVAVLLAAACATSSVAVAGTGTGLVKAIYSDLNNGTLVYVQLATPPATKPPCASNPNVDYAFDVSTPAGRAVYATLLTAYAAQTQVVIGGYDSCVLGGAYSVQAEDLRWIRAQ